MKYQIEIEEVKSCLSCKFHNLDLVCIINNEKRRLNNTPKDCPLKKVE